MGLEALSRGAASAVFVESDRDAQRTIERNLEKLGLKARIAKSDARRALAAEAAAGRPVRSRPRRPALSDARLPSSSPFHVPAGASRRGRGSSSSSRPAPSTPSCRFPSGRAASTAPCDSPSSRTDEHRPAYRDLPGQLRPGHARPPRHHQARRRDLRPGRRRVVREPSHKQTMFSVEERVGFLEEALRDQDNVEVDVFSELVVEFAKRWGASTMVKGLRVISDFEWEFQMNHLNRTLAPDVETVYLMSNPQYSFVSSSGVKRSPRSAAASTSSSPCPSRAVSGRCFPTASPARPSLRRNEKAQAEHPPVGGAGRPRRGRSRGRRSGSRSAGDEDEKPRFAGAHRGPRGCGLVLRPDRGGDRRDLCLPGVWDVVSLSCRATARPWPGTPGTEGSRSLTTTGENRAPPFELLRARTTPRASRPSESRWPSCNSRARRREVRHLGRRCR